MSGSTRIALVVGSMLAIVACDRGERLEEGAPVDLRAPTRLENDAGLVDQASPVTSVADPDVDGEGVSVTSDGQIAGADLESLSSAESQPPAYSLYPGGLAPPPPPNLSSGVSTLLAELRNLLADRDMQGAERLLGSARSRAATADDRSEVERYWLVARSLGQFWDAVRNGVSYLGPGQSLQIEGETWKVVERHDFEVVLESANGERRTMSLLREDIEPALAEAIAMKRMSRSGPAGKRALAAFHLFDGEGDRERAAQLAREMVAQGLDIDVFLPGLPVDQGP